MILIDTSAWVEFLRGTHHRAAAQVVDALCGDIAVCDPIRMEVLSGARDDRNLSDLRRLLDRATILPTTSVHYEDAARLYRTGRAAGLTVRRHMDCLIAAVAIAHEVPVLHADRDFDALAQVSPLVTVEPTAYP